MDEQLETTNRDDILKTVLTHSWANAQHHSSERLAFVRLYLIVAAGAIAFLELTRASLGVDLVAALFVVLFGLLTIRIAVRFKERIVRDMRVAFLGTEMLLGEDVEYHQVLTLFKDYRSSKSKPSISSRLSTTRHLILTVEIISSALVGIALEPILTVGWPGVVGVGLGVLFLHEVALYIMQRGLAFNV